MLGKMKLVVSILRRGQGAAFARLLTEKHIVLHHQCIGRGTATSDMMDMLGLGTAEKDVLLSLGFSDAVDPALRELSDSMGSGGQGKGKGLVFSLPLTGISSLVAAGIRATTTLEEKTEEDEKMQESKNSLILVVVNQGYTDAVMDTAKKAGATGGTIIRARWSGGEQIEQFYGITLQSEREVIVIVTSNDKRNHIMEDINLHHGLKTDAHAMVCSLPVDKAFKLA